MPLRSFRDLVLRGNGGEANPSYRRLGANWVGFLSWLRQDYGFTLADIMPRREPVPAPHRSVRVDLSEAEGLTELCEGADAVVHRAGVPSPDAEIDALLTANILATTHLLQAALAAGCRRFVFASSAQSIEGYPVDRQIVSDMAVAPANLYGVTKCYGEALCAYYATQKCLSCVALRIGAFEPVEGHALANARDLSAWLSPKDAVHLFTRAIEADIDGFFIGHGISNNRSKRLDLTETKRVLGYASVDDAFATFDLRLGPDSDQDVMISAAESD